MCSPIRTGTRERTQQQQSAAVALVVAPLALKDGAVGVEHAAPATALALSPLALIALFAGEEVGSIALRPVRRVSHTCKRRGNMLIYTN